MKRYAFLFFFMLVGLATVDAISACSFNAGNGTNVDHVTMIVGSTRVVSFTWNNDSSETWQPSNNYKIGSQHPRDNMTWGVNRQAISVSSVAPGNSFTQNISLKAPTTPGHYSAQFAILKEGDHWLYPDTLCGPLDVNVVVPNLSIINLHAIRSMKQNNSNGAVFTIVVKNTGSTDLFVNDNAFVTLFARLESSSGNGSFVSLGSKRLKNAANNGKFGTAGEQSYQWEVDESTFAPFINQTIVVEAHLTTSDQSQTGMALPVTVPGMVAGETVIEEVRGNDWRTFVFIKKTTPVVVDDATPFASVLAGIVAMLLLITSRHLHRKRSSGDS